MRIFLLRTMQAMMLFCIWVLGWLIIGFVREEASKISVRGQEKPVPFCGNVYEMVNRIDGRVLFNANCASCHKRDMVLTGPALRGVLDRWPDKKRLHLWIRNSSAVIKSGDVYANALFREFGKIRMSEFPSLTDAEIDAILAYVN